MNLFSKHEALLKRAIQAIAERSFYTPYPEHHKSYEDPGSAEFESLLGNQFLGLDDAKEDPNWIGEEVSPYTLEPLGVQYPQREVASYVAAAERSMKSWKARSIEGRAGILLESLERLTNQYYTMAHATMHTTGQSFMMAFQASGPHANDRALEAVALTYQELCRFPSHVVWEKPMGKNNVTLDKWFRPVPKGISVAIGCSTFPVWNTVPGVYASLMAGNSIIIKPHPGAVLPIALVVRQLRQLLAELGENPNVIQLLPDSAASPITKELVEQEQVKIIDYTGGTPFGTYIESLPNKTTFTEKAGVNPVILDSVENLDAVLQNLAFSVTLYSGQMCTAPQNFFVPETGVLEGDQVIPFDEVVERFAKSIENLVNHPKIGAGTMAAIQNQRTIDRLAESTASIDEVLQQRQVEFPGFPKVRNASPTLAVVNGMERTTYEQEYFGPMALMIKAKNTDDAIRLAAGSVARHGAITCAAYTIDAEVEEKIREAMELVFVSVSFNLTGPIWVNQAAAFSDFHVSGGNPAGNATFANPEFVNKRFVWLGHRKPRAK